VNINNAFPSKWLKSADIPEDADLVLTVNRVEIVEVGQGEDAEQKPVIYFDETEKGLVLNKTNAGTISKLHSPETDNWPGKKLALFATEVDFGGKQTLAIRVRLKAPKATTASPASSVSPVARQRWDALVLRAREAGITADFDIHPTDNLATLTERAAKIRSAIDRLASMELTEV